MAGDDACPPGAYAVRHVYFGGVDDSRGCTPCTCAAENFSCGAEIDAYPSTALSCTGLPDRYAAPFTCEPVNQPANFELTLTPTLGSCTPSTTTPAGAATPVSPVTICCAQ
jgi:hypothetical protein